MGKSGTDIREGKCSWIFVAVLPLLDPIQKKKLLDNFGIHDDECEERVKEVYRDINTPKVWEEYKQGVVDEINQKIDLVPNEKIRNLLREFNDISVVSIYQRKKPKSQ